MFFVYIYPLERYPGYTMLFIFNYLHTYIFMNRSLPPCFNCLTNVGPFFRFIRDLLLNPPCYEIASSIQGKSSALLFPPNNGPAYCPLLGIRVLFVVITLIFFCSVLCFLLHLMLLTCQSS